MNNKELRQNYHLNELDDIAEAKEGITETKGRIMHAQIYNVYQLPIRANEENTKLDKQLREMKKYLDTEKQNRAKLKNMEQMMQPIIDSEEEPEKHDNGTDVFEPMQTQLEESTKQQK